MHLLFITGTDTSVGKTVLTALLLAHLRQTGHRAVALKPFCSGSRVDARLLHSLQAPDKNSEIKNQKPKTKNPLTLDEINPFHFPEPLAPLVAARKHRRRISLDDVLAHIRAVSTLHALRSTLLIEGAGGLLAPLGENYNLLDLIIRLSPNRTSSKHPASSIQHPVSALIVAPNRLGTINHTLLTARALQASGVQQLAIVLMAGRKPDPSSRSNPNLLRELLAPIPVHMLPFLGPNCSKPAVLQHHAVKLTSSLAAILQ